MSAIAPRRLLALVGPRRLAARPGRRAATCAPREAGLLRVCADPDNMPLSNEKGEGYENKIAELIAKEWNSKLEYAWWPMRRGYLPRHSTAATATWRSRRPPGSTWPAVTKPYFRSGYVFVTRKDSGLEHQVARRPPAQAAEDRRQHLHSDAENTPPAMALSRYGVVGNLTGYSTFYSDQDRPEAIIKAVANKEVDLAIAWGPLAGYFAKQSPCR